MAAEMAVESTAQEEIQTEDRHQTVQEDHSQVDLTAQEDHTARVMREELTETVHREEATVKAETDHREELTAKAETVRREELMARVVTDQEDLA